MLWTCSAYMAESVETLEEFQTVVFEINISCSDKNMRLCEWRTYRRTPSLLSPVSQHSPLTRSQFPALTARHKLHRVGTINLFWDYKTFYSGLCHIIILSECNYETEEIHNKIFCNQLLIIWICKLLNLHPIWTFISWSNVYIAPVVSTQGSSWSKLKV